MAKNRKVIPFKQAASEEPPLSGTEGHDAVTYGMQPLRDPNKHLLTGSDETIQTLDPAEEDFINDHYQGTGWVEGKPDPTEWR
jgi:hypothetical protein